MRKSISELMRDHGYYVTLVESLNKKNTINEQYEGLEGLRDNIIDSTRWYREEINNKHLPLDVDDYTAAVVSALENYLRSYPEVTVYDIINQDELKNYIVSCISGNAGEVDDDIVADYIIGKVGDSDEFDVDAIEINFPEDDEY